MNKIILQGKWRQLRGNLKTEWGRFTENDRRQLDGKRQAALYPVHRAACLFYRLVVVDRGCRR